MQHELKDHKDIDLKEYIVDGIRQGFRIDFDHGKCTCNEIRGRQYGISGVLSVICSRLPSNRTESRTCCEIPMECIPAVQISWFGVIPKASQPGKWRLILDVSAHMVQV